MSVDETYEYVQRVLGRESTKAGRLRRALLRCLVEHQEHGALPTSGRFLFYELEQSGVIPKAYRHANGSKKARLPSQDVSDALTVLREAGVVPWEWIVDEGRLLVEWDYATSVAEYLRLACLSARIDAWDGMPPPLVVTESRSLAGVLRETVADYLCPIVATAGQASGALLALDVAPLLRRDADRHVVYLGDFDFQGEDIEQATRRRLEAHVGQTLSWERLALTAEQVELSTSHASRSSMVASSRRVGMRRSRRRRCGRTRSSDSFASGWTRCCPRRCRTYSYAKRHNAAPISPDTTGEAPVR